MPMEVVSKYVYQSFKIISAETKYSKAMKILNNH